MPFKPIHRSVFVPPTTPLFIGSAGGVDPNSPPILTGLSITGLSGGFAEVWSTVTATPSLAGGAPTTYDWDWFLDGSNLQGYVAQTLTILPEFTGNLTATLAVSNAFGDDALTSAAVAIRFPQPALRETALSITGTVGDPISIALRNYFNDRNPENQPATYLTYALLSGSLPPGLSLVAGVISGTLSASVTNLNCVIRASNSGGFVDLPVSATVAAGAGGSVITYIDQEYASSSDTSAGWTTTGALTFLVNSTAVVTGLEPYAGALEISGLSAASNSRAEYIVPVVPGETIRTTLSVAGRRFGATGATATVRGRWETAEGAQVGASAAFAASGIALTTTESILYNGSFEGVAPATAARFVVAVFANLWSGASPASLLKVYRIRVQRVPVAPPAIITAASISGTPRIGQTLTANYTVEPAGTAVTIQWRRGGANQSIGATYVLAAADDTASIDYVVTPTGGAPVTASPVVPTYNAPVFSGPASIGPSSLEVGQTLTWPAITATDATASYSLTDADGTVVATGTGAGSHVTAEIGTYRLTWTATNSGGTVTSVATAVTTAVAPVGTAVLVYGQSYATDRAADFQTPTAWSHAPTLNFTADTITGAMTFGTPSANSETQFLIRPWAAGDRAEVFLRSKITGNGSNTAETFFQFRTAAGATIAGGSSPTYATGEIQWDAVAPATTAFLYIGMRIRGVNAGSRKYELHQLVVTDITDSGPTPFYTGQAPQFWAIEAPVGGTSAPLDFAASFSGTVTGYEYDGPEPHTWTGSQLRISPTAVSVETGNYRVYARRGPQRSFNGAKVAVWSAANTSALLEHVSLPMPDHSIEVGRGMPCIDVTRHVQGGVLPYTFVKTAGPAWVEMEPNGVCYGVAPATPAASAPLTVRVTDAAGTILDVTSNLTVIAARSRVPTHTIPAGANVAAWLLANGAPGQVVRLLDNTTYVGGGGNTAWQSTNINNPLILLGGPGTVCGPLDLDNIAGGIIIENINFVRSVMVDDRVDDRAQYGLRVGGVNVTINDCRCEGYVDTTPIVITSTTSDVPPRPRSSYTKANGVVANIIWVVHNLPEGTAYGNGFGLKAKSGVLNNCVAYRCYESFNLTAREAAMYNCLSLEPRDDHFVISSTLGGVLYRCRAEGAFGNYTAGDHRDLLQGFGQNSPGTMRLTIKDCWFDTQGTDDVQGILHDNDAWTTSDTRITNGNSDCWFEGNVFLPTSFNGAHFSWFINSNFVNNVIVRHPDQTFNRSSQTVIGTPSQITFTNNLMQQFGIGANAVPFEHLVSLTGNHLLVGSRAGAVNVAGGAVAVFPNWANTGLVHDDPRKAVAAGQPASAARFWIDPASTWGAVNPSVGPAWLRTGL